MRRRLPVHVSDQGHTGCVNITAGDYDIDALGQVIELYDAGQALFAELAKAENVTLYCPDSVKILPARWIRSVFNWTAAKH